MQQKLKIYSPDDISDNFFLQEAIEEWEQHSPLVREQARKLFESNYNKAINEYISLMKKIMDPNYGKE